VSLVEFGKQLISGTKEVIDTVRRGGGEDFMQCGLPCQS
jgi:hypothetical protein